MKHENSNHVKELFGKDSCTPEELKGHRRIVNKIVDFSFIIILIMSLIDLGIILMDFIKIIDLTSEDITFWIKESLLNSNI
jgi:hypothetical protein